MQTIPNDAYLIIIGAMKSGTSSLYHYLIQHPRICPCRVKEPEFFSDRQAHRYNGVTRYEDLWSFSPETHRYAMEASTGYTKFPEERNIPEKIYQYGLRPKFIYLVRNPFDRILSQYNHYSSKVSGFDPSTPLTWTTFVSLSNYFLQLTRYRQYFPRETFLILDFDELKSAPQHCLKKVCAFCELSDDPYTSIDFRTHNRTMLNAEKVISRHRLLQATFRRLPSPGRRLAIGVMRKIVKERAFTDKERHAVFNLLAGDMRRFQKEYQFDVSKWGW